ncbi:formimidoylglutamate deiminase [Mycolicibacterium sp. P1-5]|uniref:formimidoylglutamate deiminase n=1 Tax=Mycolicibacterium sp. P1-5 TaxID=2024617 RepID=UPI0011EFE2F9|nr:formimidoylglutamate deiminase [Mycolicibacterium sp. P1-5]KAA0099108.1 formimidoylglutamate deiminase [Mycolicibacterium sp. P1-5]
MTDTWWCEYAWLGGAGVARRVTISVASARIVDVRIDSDPVPTARRLRGLVLPGLANAHSHAFHRALRSRTQRDRGSFWTWRDLMYRAADRLNPDSYRTLARAVYAEMALAGITAVGEFHYLHHDVGGAHYADPNAMGHAVIDGAADAGIRITLLDACYLSAGPDGAPLIDGPQLRFGDGSGEQWASRVEALSSDYAHRPSVVIGAALHSVRAVPIKDMPAVVEWAAGQRVPLHVHSSEQPAEVEQCLTAHGRTPTGVLRDVGALGPRTTAVHATHLTEGDLITLDQTATGVCFCPTTERDLGDGIGPAPTLLAGRGLFSLGSDSHAMIDLFAEARAVELDERLHSGRRGIISADRLLLSATDDGQAALGWADAGRLAVGSRADFVAVDVESLRTVGGGATVENIVFAASASDVTDVVVDGRVVVKDRRHLLVPNAVAELADSINDLMGSTSKPQP